MLLVIESRELGLVQASCLAVQALRRTGWLLLTDCRADRSRDGAADDPPRLVLRTLIAEWTGLLGHSAMHYLALGHAKF